MKKLWQKDYQADKLVEKYCFEEGVTYDNSLVFYDVVGSIAHACALNKLGIITDKELHQIKIALSEIISLYEKGKFKIELGDEDVHTKVENYLVAKLGQLGKKIHTARSRNDQIAVDLRLYTKEQLFKTTELMKKLFKSMMQFAKRYEYVAMPGYTHMQKAMPSSVGMWMGSFMESLLDDLHSILGAYQLNDQNPLGAGAAYGLSLPIDRQLTTELLGFKKIINNSLYSVVSRAKSHLQAVQALVQVMLTLSRFAQDMLLFTTSEFNYFSVSEKLCTGSSIMPQKKNLDIMEFLRAKTYVVIGYEQTIATINAGLPSGYNADFGETKGPLIKSFQIVTQSMEMTCLLVESMKPKIDVLKKAMTKELYATHAAYELVKKGMAFRDAYIKIGKSLDKLLQYDSQEILKMSDHIGGTGNLNLDIISAKFLKLIQQINQEKKSFKTIVNKLINKEYEAE